MKGGCLPLARQYWHPMDWLIDSVYGFPADRKTQKTKKMRNTDPKLSLVFCLKCFVDRCLSLCAFSFVHCIVLLLITTFGIFTLSFIIILYTSGLWTYRHFSCRKLKVSLSSITIYSFHNNQFWIGPRKWRINYIYILY